MKDFPNKMEIASSVSFKDVDNRNVITTVEQVKIERIELHFELILIDMEDNDQIQGEISADLQRPFSLNWKRA